MNEEQQNKTIAKHCGWRQSKSSMWEGWWHEKGKHTYQRFCPNFCEDLNAMHEAENCLLADEKEIYWNYLFDHCDGTVFSRVEDDYKMIHATAAQRAEAFLKTLKLWKEQ